MKYGLVRATLWILAFLGLSLSPLAVAYVGPVPARTFWVEVGVALGFVGLALMWLQFALTGRNPRVAPSFGLDSMLQYHRQLGIVSVAFVLAHPVTLFLADSSYLSYLDPRVNFMRALALSAVTGALLLIVATSLWRLAFRLSYEWWRLVHGVLAFGIVFIGVVHMIQVGYYVSGLWKQAFFVGISAGAVGLLVNTRFLRPWRMRDKAYRVAELREERGDTWTLALEPDGHEGMRFLAGQFAWITLQESPFSLQQNPYSFSSSADAAPGRLEFTIKVEGDFSASVREAKPGQRAFLEGPYGYFVPEGDPKVGCVMIVGGVGVTPCMSMIRTFADREDPRNLHLIYANPSLDDVIFYRELARLQGKLDLTITHVLEKPPEDWDGESGFLDEGVLARHIPEDRNRYEYFICGPEPMMNIAEEALASLGVEQGNVFSERFGMV